MTLGSNATVLKKAILEIWKNLLKAVLESVEVLKV